MAWGTYCKAELYFSRKTYTNKWEAEEDLEDVRKDMKRIEQQIAMLCAGNAKDLLNCKDCENYPMDAVDVLTTKLQELKEWYQEALINEYKLELLLENWDTRTGDFIDQEKLKEELTNKNKKE